MDEELKEAVLTPTGRTRGEGDIKEPPQFILDVAKRINQFITDNGWNWCMMDRVYRILKIIHT